MVRRVISEEASKKTALALESVVTNGTGRNAFIDGYRVGGKTGTAQKVKDGAYMSGNYILSFIGFLPADNPKVVVYIPKSEDAKEKNYQLWDKRYAEVPNVVNQKLSDVKGSLQKFDVQYTGSGEYILFQSPSAGERVYEGSKIRILLGDKK